MEEITAETEVMKIEKNEEIRKELIEGSIEEIGKTAESEDRTSSKRKRRVPRSRRKKRKVGSPSGGSSSKK